MPKLKNINPLGGVEVPLVGRTLAAGEEFDVTEKQAERLLMQASNYERVKDSTSASTKKKG